MQKDTYGGRNIKYVDNNNLETQTSETNLGVFLTIPFWQVIKDELKRVRGSPVKEKVNPCNTGLNYQCLAKIIRGWYLKYFYHRKSGRKSGISEAKTRAFTENGYRRTLLRVKLCAFLPPKFTC